MLTPDGYAALTEEHRALTTRERPEAASRLAEARAALFCRRALEDGWKVVGNYDQRFGHDALSIRRAVYFSAQQLA